MSNVVIPVPSLIQGISQQPALLRQASQGALQENAYPSAIDGLQKRQPTKHVAQAFAGGAGNPLVHVIDRGDTERYAAVVLPSLTSPDGDPEKSRLRVFDLNTGAEKTVNGPSAGALDTTYLALPMVATAQTIADPDFSAGGGWAVANNVAFGTQVTVTPPLGLRYTGTNPYTKVYRIGNSGSSAATYTSNNGADWGSALDASGVTFSCFFHRDTSNSSTAVALKIRTNGTTDHSATFALSASGAYTATVQSTTLATGLVEAFPNGWFRLSVTYVPATSEVGQACRAQVAFPATANATLLAWGARFDTGDAPKDWTENPQVDLRALTVADYTFLLNTTKAAALNGNVGGVDPNQTAGFVFVRAGNYRTNYKVTLKRSGAAAVTTTVSTWSGDASNSDLDTWTLHVTNPGSVGGVWHLTAMDTQVTYTVLGGDTSQSIHNGLAAALITALPNYSTNEFSVIHNGSNGTTQGPAGVMTMIARFATQEIHAAKTNASGGAATLTQGALTELTTIKTDEIATALAAAIVALGDGWGATAYGSIVKVTNSTSSVVIEQLECEDSQGNTNLVSVWNSVESFDVLPTVCEHNHVITVAGDPVEHTDDYYLKFVAELGSGVGKGYWAETLRPSTPANNDYTQTTIDSGTVPHQLVRVADGTFEFGPVAWVDRLVGDDTTTPVPTFLSSTTVDRYIDDIFFWKDRLGFLSGQNVCMSEVNRYFNFFRTTARQLLDSDRIDTAVNSTKVVHLRHAAAFDDSLFLFTDHAQFAMTHGEVLSPRTVQVAPQLEYTVQETARPLVSARGIFFATSHGPYSSLKQLIGAANTQRMVELDVGAQVPRYITGAATDLMGTDTESVVAIRSDGEPGSLFLYSYKDVGDQRVQSAWHKYTFGTDASILGGAFIGSTLYLVLQRYYGVTVEAIRFASGETDGSLGYLVALDRRFDAGPYTAVVGTYAAGNTTWVVPYTVDTDEVCQAVRADTGALVATSQATDGSNVTTLTATGVDLSAVNVYVGRKYTMRYQPTPPLMRAPATLGHTPITSGRLQVLRARLALQASQYALVAVTPELRTTEYATFDSASSDDAFLDFAVGSVSNQVLIEISNDTHRPSNLVNIEWECLYSTRSVRTPS